MEDFVARSSRWRLALLLLAAAAFVAGGLWMGGAFGPAPESSRYPAEFTFVLGWFCAIFFGLCGIMAAKSLFGASEPLRIGPVGVRWTPWSTETIPWSDITDVTTWKSRGQTMIVLHLRDPSRFPGRGWLSRLAGINRRLTGGDVAISLTATDRSPAEAMAAIERFRQQIKNSG